MAQRAGWLAVALVGVLLIAGLALLGRDIHRLARTGPRWQRRLLGAGLVLLGALGFPSCGEADPSADKSIPSTATPAGDKARSLQETVGWLRISTVWNEAEEIASGKRGPYPFDEAGKKRVLAALADAEQEVETLARKGLLNDSEAGLLKLELARLTFGVQAKRPTEEQNATCYRTMSLGDRVKMTAERVAARLPLLEKLAGDKRLNSIVVRKVLAVLEADVAALSDQSQLVGHLAAERPKVEETRKAAAALVARLKAAMEEP